VPLDLPYVKCRTGVCPRLPPTAAPPLDSAVVTLNPTTGLFGSDLANEYLLAHTEQKFTRDELRQLARNSIRASFLPAETKPHGSRASTLSSNETGFGIFCPKGPKYGYRPSHPFSQYRGMMFW